MKNLRQMIKHLNEKFPGCNAVAREEFDGSQCDGIWFRGSESCYIDEMPMYNAYGYEETFGTHPDLEEELNANGWYSEAYDAGTLMAYKG